MEPQPKPVQRVLLIASGSLLDEGVESLLKPEIDLQVSGITPTDETTLLEDIARVQPDVILLNEVEPSDAARIFALLQGVPAVRMIVVRLNTNTVDVYQKQQVQGVKSNDLLALIRGGEGEVRPEPKQDTH